MRLYYEYNGAYISMNIKSFIDIDNYNNDRITQSLRLSLTKKYKISLDNFLLSKGYMISECGFCGTPSLYDLRFDIEPFRRSYIIKEYYIRYPKSEYYCYRKNNKCNGHKYNPNSVKFVSITNGVDEEDALNVIHKRNKSPFYRINHKSDELYEQYQRRDVNFFGNQEKYDLYKERLKESHTIDSYIKRFGEDIGTFKYNKICKSKDSMSMEFFINKYGDVNKASIAYNNRLKLVSQNLEGFKRRYGDEEGQSKYTNFINNLKYRNSIEGYIDRYGEEEGLRKRMEWISKITDNNKFHSIESMKLFESNISDDILNSDDVYYGENEYFLSNKGSIFYYDFTNIKDMYIIEYNGKIWHPDKEIYTDDEWNQWEHPFNKELTAQEVYDRDKDKINLAKERGFDVLVIWDFEQNKDEKIKKFIKNITL